MAEWNAFYHNNEEEEEQEEGEQFRGKLGNFYALIFDISVISLVLIMFSHQSGCV